ncbi:MAG: glycosyltransferase family 4 protein [Candidatus Rokubacteria bacterium]|nr:glycosyltransferase family 4 protein [Candidatus Rokubacteria bacterium]
MPAAVLFVIDNLEFGGGERGFLQVIEALAGDGRRVTVACHPGGVFTARARAAGAAIVPLDMRRRAAPATIARLRRAIRAAGARVVHSQGARADFVTRVALVGVPDVRLVCTVQMPPAGFDVSAVRRRLYAALDRALAGRVDRFIVVSPALRRRLVDAGVPPARVRVIPNGVEPAPTDVSLLRAVEIAVVPSRREGFPMITLEAMSVGTPVVATAIDGIQEQIESDVDGLLVSPGDATSLADAVVRLFGDAALREKLGAAARRRVETSFTVAGVVAATRRVYAELEAAAG